MLCDCDNEFSDNFVGGIGNPSRQRLEGCGYDPVCYISTAQLGVVPYTTQSAITGRVGGNLQFLIPATDDGGTGQLDPVIFASILANVTTEINGFISSIYPIPLAKTGTVAVVQVTTISTDGLGTITGIQMLSNGSYLSAPGTTNAPAYLRFINPLAYQNCWGWVYQPQFQLGTGASLTVIYTTPTAPITPQNPFMVSGVPVIANGGTKYQVGDLLVLTGGTSFVPDKITNAATTMFCFELLRRRLNPNEKNLFDYDCKKVKQELLEISNGEKVMDGTYRDFFSPVISWNQQSVLFGANSL